MDPEGLEELDRDREDDRRVVRRADLEQRLQVAELHGDRLLRHHRRGVLEPLGGLELALGRDDLRAPLALGLGLARHRALHVARDLDVLHLDDRDLDPPRRGCLVDDRLEDLVDLVALGEQLVEDVLPEHRPERRLRDLRRRDHVVLDLHDRGLRLDDPEVGDGVDAHRDVVLRDHLLRRDVERHRPQVDLHHPVDERDEEEEARALRLGEQPAEPEDDAALVLARDLDGRRTAGRSAGRRSTARTIERDGHQALSVGCGDPTTRREVLLDGFDRDVLARDERRRRPPARARQSSPPTATQPSRRTTASPADERARRRPRRGYGAP